MDKSANRLSEMTGDSADESSIPKETERGLQSLTYREV
jgi:hypothetical protein